MPAEDQTAIVGGRGELVTPIEDVGLAESMTGKRSEPEEDNPDGTHDDEHRQKRSRGRPRLDTKDETAADRRRTQIRLAQRAYRHRKDTAITTLEQKVEHLENTNAEMSKEFHRFYDLVMAEGLLGASAPHVTERFRRITDNFMRLNTMAGNNTGYISPEDERTTTTGEVPGIKRIGSSMSSGGSHSPQVAENLSGAASHTCSSGHGVATKTTPTTATQPPASLSYEVVAQATPDNASFPFYSSFDQQNLGIFRQADAPYATLPLSASYAFHEQTLGRRLQRRTTERGLLLASMASPPPERYAAVFGFSLLFESREAIVRRLAGQLSNMEMPFQTPHNQQLGPEEERIEHKIQLTFGYEKEFLNADEVELYLARLGINVPQQAEYIEAEIDINDLAKVDVTGQLTPPLTYVQSSDNGLALQGTFTELQDNKDGSSAMARNMQIQVSGGQGSNAMASFNQFGVQGIWSSATWAKAKLTISVGILVEELASKAVCMGKHPGVRIKDINNAVKVAAGLVTAC